MWILIFDAENRWISNAYRNEWFKSESHDRNWQTEKLMSKNFCIKILNVLLLYQRIDIQVHSFLVYPLLTFSFSDYVALFRSVSVVFSNFHLIQTQTSDGLFSCLNEAVNILWPINYKPYVIYGPFHMIHIEKMGFIKPWLELKIIKIK